MFRDSVTSLPFAGPLKYWVIAAVILVSSTRRCRVTIAYISMMLECGAPIRAETSGWHVAWPECTWQVKAAYPPRPQCHVSHMWGGCRLYLILPPAPVTVQCTARQVNNCRTISTTVVCLANIRSRIHLQMFVHWSPFPRHRMHPINTVCPHTIHVSACQVKTSRRNSAFRDFFKQTHIDYSLNLCHMHLQSVQWWPVVVQVHAPTM